MAIMTSQVLLPKSFTPTFEPMPIASFTFNPFQENTYVVYDATGEAAIIDCGTYDQSEEQLIGNWMKERQLKPSRHLLTHAHIDHIFGLSFIYEQYRLMPELHKAEIPVLEAGEAVAMQYGLAYRKNAGVKPAAYLSDGQVIEIGELKLQVIETPGHSPGGISLLCEQEEWVLSGDALFRESIGRTDLPGGDHPSLIASIRNRLLSLPEHYKVYSGHGPATTIGHEMSHNPFL